MTQLLADLVLLLHFAVVLFVVGGLLLIVVGALRQWSWASALWFRLLHLAAIAVVVGQSWLGIVCPLTTLEMWLRVQARTSTYSGSFVEHWVARMLYFEAPGWVFSVVYSIFGLLVVTAWVIFPPAVRRSRQS
jgi:hypothetical protein